MTPRSCRSASRPPSRAPTFSSPVAPVCEEVRAALDLEPVARERFRSRVYDSVSVGRVVAGPDGRTYSVRGLDDGGEVELGLYRLRR